MLGPSSRTFGVPALYTRFTRHFHGSASCAAARAPSLRRKERQEALQALWDTLPGRPKALNDAQWAEYQRLQRLPDPLLQSAIKDGLLNTDITTARSTANKLIRVMYSIPEPVPRASIEEIHEDLSLVAGVAHVLMRSPIHRSIAVRALRNIARTEEPISVLTLGLWAVRAKDSSRKTQIYKTITNLARKATIPQALVIYALFEQGTKSATKALQKAMEISKPVVKPTLIDAFMPDTLPAPWLEYADIMIKEKNHSEARRALKIGTEEYNSPEAYLRLAQYAFNDGDMNLYEQCLAKSAMAGNVDSAYLLGNLYLAVHLRTSKPNIPIRVNPKDFRSKYPWEDYRRMAQEWYEIALAGGKGTAGLVLAGLCRRDGKKIAYAKGYLDVALDDPVSSEKAMTVVDQWSNANWRIDILEDLIKENTSKF